MPTIKNNRSKGYPMQHYEVLQDLGDCYACTGEHIKAQECYEQAASLGPDQAGPYIGLGVIALQRELLDDAESAFKLALRIDKNSTKAYTGLAMVLQRKGAYQDAYDTYLKSLEMDCDNLTALHGLFQTAFHMKSLSKVIFYFEIYAGMHPADKSVMNMLAALYFKSGAAEKSKKLLQDILSQDSTNADAVKLLEQVQRHLAESSQQVCKQ